MNKPVFILLIILAINSCKPGSVTTSSGPEGSQDHLIMSTLWFQKSAEMRASFYQAFNLASMLLDRQLDKLPAGAAPAVVLDIDETALDNSPFQGQVILSDRPYTQEFWEKWTSLSIAEPLPGALEFLQYASSKDVKIFYVTNRKETEREATIRNLKGKGFPLEGNEFLVMRTAEGSKEKRRKSIEDNHTIVLLIGDNLNDLAEAFEKRNDDFGFAAVDSLRKEFASRFIILPNPMYGDWERPLFMDLEDSSERGKYLRRKKLLQGF